MIKFIKQFLPKRHQEKCDNIRFVTTFCKLRNNINNVKFSQEELNIISTFHGSDCLDGLLFNKIIYSAGMDAAIFLIVTLEEYE